MVAKSDKIKLTPELKFCVRYLNEHGISSEKFKIIAKAVSIRDPYFRLVPLVIPPPSFFEELASKLRELWPPGDKDGKWAWRDSVPNLADRLKVLWENRLEGKEYSIEDCLAVANRYLSRFELDTKYMQILKYFIWKQKNLINSDGKIKYIVESKFADMLEGKSDEDAVQNEWESIMSSSDFGEGNLV